MSQRRKLLFLIESLKSGGAERQLSNLMNGLVEKGESVHLITWIERPYFFSLDPRIEKVQLSRKSRFDFGPIKSIINYIKTNKIEIVHGYLDTGNLYAAICSIFNRKLSVVTSERSSKRKIRFYVKLHRRFSHGRADKIIANSQKGAEFLSLQINPEKICVIPNGIEISPEAYQRDLSIKKALNIADKARILLHVGRFIALKNQREIIEEFIRTGSSDCHLIFVGNNATDYGREVAGEFGHHNNIHFIAETSNVKQYYQAADVVLLFSKYEGTPNSVLEAFSYRCPVISSNVGDVSTYLQNGKNGWLIDSSDREGLCNSMKDFMSSSDLVLEKMGSAGFDMLIEKQMTIETMVRRHQDIYTTLQS